VASDTPTAGRVFWFPVKRLANPIPVPAASKSHLDEFWVSLKDAEAYGTLRYGVGLRSDPDRWSQHRRDAAVRIDPDGMSSIIHEYVMPLIREHGVFAIGGITMIESMGIPAPGESAVIAAALYAATTHEFGIVPLVASAAIGAIIGDNIGYVIGRRWGFGLIERYGGKIGLTKPRVKLGRYLFQRYGGRVVFFGRFVAILRTFTALLAGAIHMDWKRFLLANALGGTFWASLYGFGAYALGREIRRLEGPVAIGLGLVAAIVIGTLIVLTRRHETRLQKDAEAAFPD
jgi:membrane protein DedA with SNARE-associated domain